MLYPIKYLSMPAGPEHLSRGSSPHNASGKTGFRLTEEKAAGGSFRGDQLWLLALLVCAKGLFPLSILVSPAVQQGCQAPFPH